jgi:hypothetical protein
MHPLPLDDDSMAAAMAAAAKLAVVEGEISRPQPPVPPLP